MTVLIAGAGVAGLTLALSLHQLGIPVRVFESVREIRPLGVGINLQPHAVRELDELGLLDRLDAIGLRTRKVAYFSTHGQPVWAEPRGKTAGYAWPQFSIHRGKLQMMLFDTVRERLGPDAVRCGAAVAAWRDAGEGVEIDLVDRTSGEGLGSVSGSVFIAADGIHSSAARRFIRRGSAGLGRHRHVARHHPGAAVSRGADDGDGRLQAAQIRLLSDRGHCAR